MKPFSAEHPDPLRRAGIKDYHLSARLTEIVQGRRAVFFPRLTSRVPRVVN